MMPLDNLKSQLQSDPPNLKYDHMLMIDGENLRKGAAKSSIFFNDSENIKLLISGIEEKIGQKFSCKKMISTNKESMFSKSFQKLGVKFSEKGLKSKTFFC